MTGRSVAGSSLETAGAAPAVDVRRLRARLEEERRVLESNLESAREEQDSIDNDPITANLRASHEAVTAAITRIDTGTYGRCCGCGVSIPIERLLAIPEAMRCVSCQESWSR